MPFADFFENARRLLTTISRPDWKTYSMSVKIVFAGVGVIGVIGYTVRIISTALQM